MGGVRRYYPFDLLLEFRKEDEDDEEEDEEDDEEDDEKDDEEFMKFDKGGEREEL